MWVPGRPQVVGCGQVVSPQELEVFHHYMVLRGNNMMWIGPISLLSWGISPSAAVVMGMCLDVIPYSTKCDIFRVGVAWKAVC